MRTQTVKNFTGRLRAFGRFVGASIARLYPFAL